MTAEHADNGALTAAQHLYRLMDPLTPEERAWLKESVREHGVLVPGLKDEHGAVLEGHHRIELVAELRAEGVQVPDPAVIIRPGLSEAEKRALVRQLNLARRHLTPEQRRKVIADQLRETPDRSNRQIAEALGVDHKTVGSVKSELVSN